MGGSRRKGDPNIDPETVRGFAAEWAAFDQTVLSEEEWRTLFDRYFGLFPWQDLPRDAEGFDLGCGSGRWAFGVAPRVAKLHCIDPALDALAVARRRLAGFPGAEFHHAAAHDMPIADGSQDFGYSLGVLHHVPDTRAALADCIGKLKPGSPFLLYLYYALDNRPWWFCLIWRATDAVRWAISRLPFALRKALTTAVAALVYWPLARGARLADRAGWGIGHWPLAAYRGTSFYTMRTDALDRFGTRLEQRFSRRQIREMMESVGLEQIRFSESEPYWVAVGTKSSQTPTGTA